jgi:hypothetical protein
MDQCVLLQQQCGGWRPLCAAVSAVFGPHAPSAVSTGTVCVRVQVRALEFTSVQMPPPTVQLQPQYQYPMQQQPMAMQPQQQFAPQQQFPPQQQFVTQPQPQPQPQQPAGYYGEAKPM